LDKDVSGEIEPEIVQVSF